MSSDKHPWERQKGESSRIYGYFQMYLELGYNRTVTKLLENNADTPSREILRKYSAKYDWVNRAAAYDDYLREKLQKKHEYELLSLFAQEFTSQKKRIDELNVLMNDLPLEEDINKRAATFRTCQETHRKIIEELLLFIGKPQEITKTENSSKVDVNATVGVKYDGEAEMLKINKLLDDKE